MPVNVYHRYTLTWMPVRSELTTPYYVSLAAQMERDIETGILPNRVKLPPQRELADYLDLSLSTVTKAYRLCEEKGLISGRTGSGTYVCADTDGDRRTCDVENSYIQMGSIVPFPVHNARVAQAAAEMMSRSTGEEYFSYDDGILYRKQLRAGQKWLSHFGVIADDRHILMTAGAQNALSITLGALFHAGARIAVDRYTYAGFAGLCAMYGIFLLPVEGDGQGMLPDALDTLCRSQSVQGVFLMPSCGSPTNAVMNMDRRMALAEVLRRRELLLVEDDSYAFLLENCPIPLCTLYPERTVYISSLSKSVCAGLRTAFLYASPILFPALESGAYYCSLKPSLLNFSIAAELIEKDVHLEIMADKRRLALLRNACFARYFPEEVSKRNPASFFQWVSLPEPLRGSDVEIQAAGRHVRVLDGARFASDGSRDVHAVRVATCSPKTVKDLERGLQVLRSLIAAYQTAGRENLRTV